MESNPSKFGPLLFETRVRTSQLPACFSVVKSMKKNIFQVYSTFDGGPCFKALLRILPSVTKQDEIEKHQILSCRLLHVALCFCRIDRSRCWLNYSPHLRRNRETTRNFEGRRCVDFRIIEQLQSSSGISGFKISHFGTGAAAY